MPGPLGNTNNLIDWSPGSSVWDLMQKADPKFAFQRFLTTSGIDRSSQLGRFSQSQYLPLFNQFLGEMPDNPDRNFSDFLTQMPGGPQSMQRMYGNQPDYMRGVRQGNFPPRLRFLRF